MKLENWGMVSIPAHSCQTPELGIMCLSGEIYGSSEFAEGTNITTSEIVGRSGELVVTRSGSHYELGQPHPEYERLFPNARTRILTTLEQL